MRSPNEVRGNNRLNAVIEDTLITKKDKKRKQYHNYHCQGKWGDSRLYDLSINSSRLGIDKTVDMLEEYIKARIADEQNKH